MMGVFSDAMAPSTMTGTPEHAHDPWPAWDDPAPRATPSMPAAYSTEEPIPLYPPLPLAERYPTEALGPLLSNAAVAICRKVQVPDAIAAQSVLAAAALAVQAHADVRLPYGQTRPLSLSFITVAGSGDRKTTADTEALRPVRRRETALRDEHGVAYREWVVARAAWNAEKRKIEANKNLDLVGRTAELRALGPEPSEPLHPMLTAGDPTVEGLVKAWVLAPASLGLFSAEGGQFIGGHGMSAENRLRTAATLSQFWDGQPIKRVRAMDGVTILEGRRLSMHLMVQPDAAARFLSDPILRNQGLISRFLVAAPDSIAGTRLYRQPDPDDEERIRSYTARILSVLEAPWPLTHGRRNELQPRVLEPEAEAADAWCRFHDHVEVQCGRERELADVQDFAAKAAEHAGRLAGVLTVIGDVDATTVALPEMACALKLVDWYVSEALRLHSAARTDPKLLRAQTLLDWLKRRPDPVIEFRDILRFGPTAVRQKASADEAIGVLKSHLWLEEISSRPRRFRLKQA